MPGPTVDDVTQLRRITGVGATEYTVDGVAYWTDLQLETVLTSHTVDGVIDFTAAAAEVLEAWAARLALSYDVTIDGQSMKRSQRAEQIRRRAADYRIRAGGGDIRTVNIEAPL